MATIVELTTAVTDKLNATSFSLFFVATRYYRPRHELRSLQTLAVSVVPRAATITPESRTLDRWEYQIDVAIQKKLADESVEEIDPLMELVDEIAREFRLWRPPTHPEAVCAEVANEPIYAVEHLEQLRVFTSVITLTFRMVGSSTMGG